MDGKRAAPRKGRRVVFVGDGVPTSCQRGSAALLGPLWEGAVGAADWGRAKRVAALPPSALRADTSLSEGGEERRIPTPVFAPARNDRERADRVVRPYKLGMTGSTAALRAMHAASALSYTGAGGGYTVRRCGGGSWFLGICALGLGLGILIAAVFPVGCLMFLVAFLLIACGVACLRDRR